MPGMARTSDRIPLTPAVFHILLALADGEKHGYAVMKEVEAHTQGRIRLGPGTLYGSFDRLLAVRLIEECPSPPNDQASSHHRRYYRLTAPGRLALREETQRLRSAVAHARRKGVFGEAKAERA
jgi:DNA-binding PadR family transcriptional regulator